MAATMTNGTPAAEVEIDERLVRRLLREQHPDLADQTLSLVDVGWDNATYRLGEEHAVRLPRRRLAVALIENEQRWLPVLAESLPFPVPVPTRIGRPGGDYPWPWSIVRWLHGRTADVAPAAATQAEAFTGFLRALHRPAPPDVPHNEFRGVPLRQKATGVEERLNRLRQVRDIGPNVLQTWAEALAAPEATEFRWLHGDLHARNVLVDDGRICGIIDWGDITGGDVATDLASIWSLFDEPAARAACLSAYGASPAELARARGWAVLFAAALLDTGLVDHPRHAAMGEAIFRRLLDDCQGVAGW
jgi:aminoglycoside phosphotransferase (APT) family kinase protein